MEGVLRERPLKAKVRDGEKEFTGPTNSKEHFSPSEQHDREQDRGGGQEMPGILQSQIKGLPSDMGRNRGVTSTKETCHEIFKKHKCQRLLIKEIIHRRVKMLKANS